MDDFPVIHFLFLGQLRLVLAEGLLRKLLWFLATPNTHILLAIVATGLYPSLESGATSWL
jgi:hypothetical protein